MLALSSLSQAAAAIARARSVTLVAYLLPRGDVMRALAAAAKRGAHVVVRLEGAPYYDREGGVRRLNESVVRELAKDGADARLVDARGTRPFHAKAVLADGALYLDDVNFSGGASGTIVRDGSRADAAMLEDAVEGRVDPPGARFALRKEDALDLEAALLGKASGARAEVESESVGIGNLVYSRLERLGEAGMKPRLLVSREALGAKECERLRSLCAHGVAVRICRSNEKFAVAGGRAWVGSANATSPYPNLTQLDWGALTRNRSIVRDLQRRFETRWRTARGVTA